MTEIKDKLKDLRAELTRQHVDGFLIPRSDEFQGEYVPACAERLAWLTGFTGSAGHAVALSGKAVVMTDSRYTIQIKNQVDPTLFEIADSGETSIADWLLKNAQTGQKIGYDPKLHTPAQIKALAARLKPRQIELVALAANPLDAVWQNRPKPPADPAELFPDAVAGRTALEKRDEIARVVQGEGGKAMVLASPDSIAWLLNIRGNDVPHTPFALSYAIVHDDGGVDWFIDPAKVPAAVAQHLGPDVRICPPAALDGALKTLAGQAQAEGRSVLLDYAHSSQWFLQTLESAGAAVEDFADPCTLPKACKTPSEQAAIIESHIRDGVAMARFLKWLDDEAPKGSLTELDVEDRLLAFRRMDPDLRDTSFDTIPGWAGNGAIVHYRATPESNTTITPPGLLLVDSGGQYGIGGTTDITRTVAVGTPTEEMRESFTRVLKGHIGVASARFPADVTGAQIDTLARKALWDAGMDYDHGTGHGVGCYLSVHESATGIHKRSTAPFRPGMLISNEPGFYKEGAYGIRIESLVLVKENGLRQGTQKKMLEFETVTLAPIDRRLIKAELLSDAELGWLNDYHARVYRTLSPRLEDDVKAWLKDATAPLKKNKGPVVTPKQTRQP